MQIGKLTNKQLEELVLSRLPALSSSTVVGAGIGADCAWLRSEDGMIVTSSDPITAGGNCAGTLAVSVSCNDIAACGVRPTGLLLVLIAPPSAEEGDIINIVEQASAEAKRLGVDIVGGHTEVSDVVNDFVVISTAIGNVSKKDPVIKGKAQAGDSLIVTKTCGIEGSFIAANVHRDKLEGKVPAEYLDEAATYNKYLSVVAEGVCAGRIADPSGKVTDTGFKASAVSLMHDVTEGGVMGASYEMALFSGTGVLLDTAKIPVSEVTRKIAETAGLDVLRLISSGSILIATAYPELVMEQLSKEGINTAVIGKFTDKAGIYEYLDEDGKICEMPPPGADEIYKL